MSPPLARLRALGEASAAAAVGACCGRWSGFRSCRAAVRGTEGHAVDPPRAYRETTPIQGALQGAHDSSEPAQPLGNRVNPPHRRFDRLHRMLPRSRPGMKHRRRRRLRRRSLRSSGLPCRDRFTCMSRACSNAAATRSSSSAMAVGAFGSPAAPPIQPASGSLSRPATSASSSSITAVPFLIRDRESRYSGSFHEIFRVEGIRIVKTPVRAPKANAIAERFVRTVRAECLDWLLILDRRHLDSVLRVYFDHYNHDSRRPAAIPQVSRNLPRGARHLWMPLPGCSPARAR